MDIFEELSRYNVSRETYKKLQDFVVLLSEWNTKMNLVSKNSLSDVWVRHVLDSAQLVDYIPNNVKHIVDIGSGSGFPGIVLAILLQEQNPQAHITLVESITKKALYLKNVAENLGLNSVEVVNNRVENAVFKKVDMITARAVASTDILCGYADKIGNKNTEMLLLKGRSFADEEAEAGKRWIYTREIYKNKYSDDGVIVRIKNIRMKK
ncbi:MAG: 16S rRNA (guanine(527)-N(7))-methyltransferase RsmG [Alphaproteobacteria bacterium]